MNSTAMKIEWDYSDLAAHYDKRADYSVIALKAIIKIMGLNNGDPVADIGAGTGKLTIPLAGFGLAVTAVEPNDAMRAIGKKNTVNQNIDWRKAQGENTRLPENSTKAFMMGSSFNVVDQVSCLNEAARVLQPNGWFGCMWNHRDLADETQMAIEDIIKEEIADYTYGKRRMDPSDVIAASADFDEPIHISHRFIAKMPKKAVIEAWHSHATLQRQAQDKFNKIIGKIENLIGNRDMLDVPYRTNIWIAQKRT